MKYFMHRNGFLYSLFFSLLSWLAFAQQTDIEVIKSRVYNAITSNYIDSDAPALTASFDGEVKTILSEFDGEKWPYIHYEDVSREGFDNTIHLYNLLKMAVAYKSPQSQYFNKKSLFKNIEKGLNFWCDEDFVGENWWNNQIGTPSTLVNLMLMVGDELPSDLVRRSQKIINRADINKGGSRPGGDRIKVSSIAAKNQLFLNDSSQFNLIINIIAQEVKFVDWIGSEFGYTYSNTDTGGFKEFLKANGRGLQYDNSFHHRTDGVNNTLSYGLGWSSAFVEWAHYVRNTAYAFPAEKSKILVDYYLDGVCKTAVFGQRPDYGAKNRSISRPGNTKPYSAAVPLKILDITTYRAEEIKEIVRMRTANLPGNKLSHATFFWNSEHFTFQRPNFFTSVRMYSTRNMNMESPYNSEGLLNHHRGDGANHIYTRGNEYEDISPVLDYQKIPGATIVQKEQLPHHNQIKKLGLTDFVGATTDGHYGVVGFDFKSIHDPLVARKSWFFFDEAYVCLGAGISTKSKNEVHTTLNQSLLKGPVHIAVNGQVYPLGNKSGVHSGVKWIHHDNIAYLLPQAQDISIENELASGSWWRISKQIDSSKSTEQKEVFKTWINHGVSPDRASYAYIVRPHTTLEELDDKDLVSSIEILSNSPYLQAVYDHGEKLLQVVFYKAGALEVQDGFVIKSAAPGIVMMALNDSGELAKLSVSDPNRELSKMMLTVSKKFNGKGTHFKSTWNAAQGMTEFVIDLPQGGWAGKSVVIE